MGMKSLVGFALSWEHLYSNDTHWVNWKVGFLVECGRWLSAHNFHLWRWATTLTSQSSLKMPSTEPFPEFSDWLQMFLHWQNVSPTAKQNHTDSGREGKRGNENLHTKGFPNAQREEKAFSPLLASYFRLSCSSALFYHKTLRRG